LYAARKRVLCATVLLDNVLRAALYQHTLVCEYHPASLFTCYFCVDVSAAAAAATVVLMPAEGF
jgi:hypothetical protein